MPRVSNCGVRLGLVIARFCTAAWVGAAALFVVTALREVRSSPFDPAAKDTLALLRFPAYYAFGFTLVGLALAGALLASRDRAAARDRVPSDGVPPAPPNTAQPDTAQPGTSASDRADRLPVSVAAGLLAAVLLMMLADFIFVYRPLVGMITPPGGVRVAQFGSYHRMSIWLNVGDVGLAAVAAVLLCWPNCRRHAR